jgi:hypothetical protein
MLWCQSASSAKPSESATPDLSGTWTASGPGGGNAGPSPQASASDTKVMALPARDESFANFERDSTILQRSHGNKPLYRPEYWEKVRYLDFHGNTEDPEFHCMPPGLPRIGPPARIVQLPTELIFLYAGYYGAQNTFRVIPTDGRDHHPDRAAELSFLGDSVGRWEGDTLVIETIGLSETTWLGWTGYFHTAGMKVTERLRRKGDELTWEATVEDPAVLLQPWTMEAHHRRLNRDPNAVIWEDFPCDERDSDSLVDKNVRG